MHHAPEEQGESSLMGHLIELRARLLRLEALGLVAREDAPAGNHASGEAAQPPEGRWRVAPLAYLTVREFLRGRSYLTDAF